MTAAAIRIRTVDSDPHCIRVFRTGTMIDEIEVPQPETGPVPDQAHGNNQQRVARNAGVYLVITLISWCVTFVGLSIVPRCIGEEINGQLVLAGTTVQMVFTFGGLCLETFLMREIGRDHRQADALVRATMGLRLTTMVALLVASYFALGSLHAKPVVMTYGLLWFPGAFISAMSEPLRQALAGFERARETSVSDLCVSSSSIFAIPFLLLSSKTQIVAYGAIVLICAQTIIQAATFFLRARWLRGVISLRPLFDATIWVRLIRGGVPFMLNNYVSFLYTYITLLVLNHFMKETAVGEYSQSSRLLGTFLIVPSVLAAALLPVLTRMAGQDPKAFLEAKIRVLTVLIVSCLPVMAGVILLAPPLCHLLYGAHKFVHVAQALQMGALLLLPLYIVIVVYQILVAQNKNGVWSFVMLGTLVLNTGLAWVLVPYTMKSLHNGIVGATWAMTIAEGTAMVFAFVLMRVNPFAPVLLNRVLRGLAATAAMALVIVWTRDEVGRLRLPFTYLALLQLAVPAALGACVFLLLAGLLRAFPPQEQELVVRAFKRRMGRVA